MTCDILEEIQESILTKVHYDEETDKCLNPEVHYELQQELSRHLVNCTKYDCVQSYLARCKAGIQNESGEYLREVSN